MYPLNKVLLQILNDRLKDEMTAFYNYWYISMCCVNLGYFKASDWFEKESHGEKSHAKMIIDYMLGRSNEADLPDMEQPEIEFTDLKSAINIALDMEISL